MFSNLFSTTLEDIQCAIQIDHPGRFHSALEEYADEQQMQLSKIRLQDLSVSEGTLLDCAILFSAHEMIEYLLGEGCRYSLEIYQILKRKGRNEMLERFYPSQGVCSICFEEADFYFLHNCSHSFCKDCLESWVSSNITNYTFTFKCPDRDCEYDFNPQDALNCLSCDDLKVLYSNKLFDLAMMKLLGDQYLWCPHCEEPAWTDNLAAQCATCQACEESFCPKCLKTVHEGWSCFEWGQMDEIKDDEDGLSQFWIAKRSKPCPQCKSSIQKNGGCSHMTCKTCTYEFCWICGRKYTPGNHTFNSSNCTCPVNPQDKYFETIPLIWKVFSLTEE